jgi:two-component system nitrate/nitrite response regulator NarL
MCYNMAMVTNLTDLQVLVVADDPLARAGLGSLLGGQPGCAVVSQIASDAELEDSLAVYQPDLVVWDLGWDPDAALELLADLAEVLPPVVALLPDERSVAQAQSAGASGLLLRDVSAARLSAALAGVAQGLVVLDSAFAENLPLGPDRIPDPLAEELTPRELEVVQLLARGLSNRAIAYELDISEHTVKFHVNAIMGKLGAQSRTEAAVRATRLGLIIV